MQNRRTFTFVQQGRPVAFLEHFDDTNTNRIYINKDIPLSELPAVFFVPAQVGMYELNEEISLAVIRDRVEPPGRQNIASILWAFGLKEYDEFNLLLAHKGRCCQDDCELIEGWATDPI